jgi:hypothetical protein
MDFTGFWRSFGFLKIQTVLKIHDNPTARGFLKSFKNFELAARMHENPGIAHRPWAAAASGLQPSPLRDFHPHEFEHASRDHPIVFRPSPLGDG